MSDGDKPAQSGLVDMGNISFYNLPNPSPTFTLSDLTNFPGAFGEMVLNVTWAQLQPVQGGPLDTSAIDSAIAEVEAYNAQHGTDLGIKLRVWGGYTAPEWAKDIDGPPITITGESSVDPSVYTDQTIGRFWTADYVDAWTSVQNQLAALYDNNPVIFGISQTEGAAATDEPFVPLMTAAPVSPGSSTTVNQVAELQAGGYSDAAEMLTLRASIADYAQWSTTPLDYTMNEFHLFGSGHEQPDSDFTLAVLQQALNSTRLVQAGNHALRNPLYAPDAFVYAQLSETAALDPSTPPASYQTASPDLLATLASNGTYSTFTGAYADWPNTVVAGVTSYAGDIELWNFSGPAGTGINGFLTLAPGQAQILATLLAAGTAPTTGAPDDGSALGFVAPAFVTGAPGTVAFTGVDAVLLESASSRTSYTVTLTSTDGGTLAITDLFGIASGPVSGSAITLSGPLAEVNIELASLTDTLQAGSDVVQIVATDSSGDTASRSVGVEISAAAAAAPSTTTSPETGASDPAVTSALAGSGILVVGGVQSTMVVPGNLDIGGAGNSTSLLAALAPSAYSTASLTIGSTLEVQSGGAAHFTGSLSAPAVTVDSGGTISGDGTVTASSGGAILNNGTIEAVADLTLGLQQLTVANALSGTGTLQIDPGATLTLARAVGPDQTVEFAANSIAQFANDPYSPSTLVLDTPQAVHGAITGFTFADSLVLDGVTATSASYVGTTLTVDESSGGPLTFTLSGTLAGLIPSFSVTGSGADAVSTITFVAPPAGLLPSVTAPTTLEGAARAPVLVPDIVLETPLPATPPADMTVTATLTTGTGILAAGDDNGNTTVNGNNSTTLALSGTLGEVESSLETLTYKAVDGQPTDTITITVTDYAGTSAPPTVIDVSNNSVPLQFDWSAAAGGSFGTSSNWTKSGGGAESTAPGGTNVASFGSSPSGAYTVSGDGAVGEILVTGTLTLAGQVTAQGRQGEALDVNSGGALTLADGAVLSAQGLAVVGDAGTGLLAVMGGALSIDSTSSANALLIGAAAGSTGTVVNLEQIGVAGTTVVGAAGAGTLALLGVAATVLDTNAEIGQAAGSQGSALVNGGEWTTSGTLTVGDQGNGALLVNGMDNGVVGQVMAYAVTIGNQAGSQGAVTLDGGDLLVANAAGTYSTLLIGSLGSGSLTIEDGANASVGVALATVTNNGPSSTVDNNGLLFVGGTGGGPGLVRISRDGALLVYGDAFVGGASGSGEVIVGQSADDTALFAMIGQLTIGATGEVTLSGANATVRASVLDIAPGGVLSGAGTVSGDAGGNHTVLLGPIENDGSITASGGDLLLYGQVAGSGTLSIASGATLTLQAAVGPGETLAFSADAHATLNDPYAFAGIITGFGAGDVLELASITATGVSWSNGVLTVDTTSGILQFEVPGNYAPNAFTVQSDGLGGTNVLAGGNGDVHMVTFDGVHYDFQAVGDFVAVQSTDASHPWQIQIRTASFPGATSVTTEVAAAIGGDRVTFASDRASTVYVDGVADRALQVGSVQKLADGTLTELAAGVYKLAWNSGESVTVTVRDNYLDWSVALGPHDGPGSVRGLLGSDSGQTSNFQPPNPDDWRVAPGASLLHDHGAHDHSHGWLM
jgi:T5SS/PEP-CTERM-associated repeat protein